MTASACIVRQPAQASFGAAQLTRRTHSGPRLFAAPARGWIAHRVRVGLDALVVDDAQHLAPACAAHWVAAERVEVQPRRERSRDLGRRHHRRERQPVADALRAARARSGTRRLRGWYGPRKVWQSTGHRRVLHGCPVAGQCSETSAGARALIRALKSHARAGTPGPPRRAWQLRGQTLRRLVTTAPCAGSRRCASGAGFRRAIRVSGGRRRALAMVTMSGTTPWFSKPQKCVPVRPKPVCTSSAMHRPPASRTVCRMHGRSGW